MNTRSVYRRLLETGCVRGAGLLTLFFLASLSLARAADRPNILLILADNWRWPTAGALGDPMALTPAFDRIAREGVVFTHTFNPVPSCSPTRSCLLTGRQAHELGERANLWSGFPQDTPVVTQLLRAAGYSLGYSGKPWAPGNAEVSGWKENPVGPKFTHFADFQARRTPADAPFFFWLGNTDTATRGGKHPYLAAARARLDPSRLTIPPELPDCPEVRDDLLNYYGGILQLDAEAARAIAALEKSGELENTVIIYTSDNGWQLPRGLANCYDAGSRVPLAIRWGKNLRAGRLVDAFVNVAGRLHGTRAPCRRPPRPFRLSGASHPHPRLPLSAQPPPRALARRRPRCVLHPRPPLRRRRYHARQRLPPRAPTRAHHRSLLRAHFWPPPRRRTLRPPPRSPPTHQHRRSTRLRHHPRPAASPREDLDERDPRPTPRPQV
ncbi:MAG: hypothetical protein EBU32_10745 [Opitutaceae bacterium]|nr:hypothetical protein [Opitutaceae bacterium]